MEEEIQLINENAKKEKIKKFFINNSKLIIISVLIVVLSIIFFFGLQELKLRKQIKIAERYNKIITSFQSIKNTEEVKKELVEIINSKHPTYSPLALYFILEEEIYDENTEIIANVAVIFINLNANAKINISFRSGRNIEEDTYNISSKSPKKLTNAIIDAREELIKI